MADEWTKGDIRSLVEMLGRGDDVADVSIVFDRPEDEIRDMAERLGVAVPRKTEPERTPSGRIKGDGAWSTRDRDILQRMWLKGRTSTQIAAVLGNRTRSAVMGMVGRMGLTRDPAVDIEGCDFHSVYCKAMERVASLGREDELESGIPTHHLLDIHEEIAFLMAVMLFGRNPAVIRKAFEEPLPKVMKMLRAMEATGIWHAHAPRPSRWDRPGAMAQVLVMDAMVLKGMMLIGGLPGEPRYSLPYCPDVERTEGTHALATQRHGDRP